MIKSIAVVAYFGLMSGCVSWPMVGSFDRRETSIQTMNLFNQRGKSTISDRSWTGDWVFRRERLELIDSQLRDSRPDVVAMRQLLKKVGSSADSDANILSRGSLRSYQWRLFKRAIFRDTGEQEYHGIALGLPLVFEGGALASPNVWPLAEDGFLSYALVTTPGQPLAVFNVQMPSGGEGTYLWYYFIRERILGVIAEHNICRNRVVVAGYLPGNLFIKPYADFLDYLQLKETGDGFCAVASDCVTATSLNELYLAANVIDGAGHVDKVLVHQGSYVASGSVNIDQPIDDDTYKADYGLSKLWPSTHFGWVTSVRFKECQKP